jgi:hypothetical protein
MNGALTLFGALCLVLSLTAPPAAANQQDAARSARSDSVGVALQGEQDRLHIDLHIDAEWRWSAARTGLLVEFDAADRQRAPYVEGPMVAQSASAGDSLFFAETPMLLGLTVAPGVMVLPSTDLSTDGGLIARLAF